MNSITDLKEAILEALSDRIYSDEDLIYAVEEIVGKGEMINFAKEHYAKELEPPEKTVGEAVDELFKKHSNDDIYEELMESYNLVSELTERGYNLIKCGSIAEQMEFEEAVARLYPYINQRENLFLQY